MSTYNTLYTRSICPRCNRSTDVEIQLFFGDTRYFKAYALGDEYDWIPNKAVQNGGRPEKGRYTDQGYAECQSCKRDFWVQVSVEDDILQEVEVDHTRKPYVPDKPKEQLLSDEEELTKDARPMRYGVDDDYTPELHRSLEDADLIPRTREMLRKILDGEKSAHSVEACVLLIDLGRSLEQKRKHVSACQYYFNANRIAQANRRIGGWGTAAWEYYRELRRPHRIPEDQCAIEVPVPKLLDDFIQAYGFT